ncbi:MAG: hypothetical protein AAFS10_13515 [Myxococcota bacterium]
MTVGHLLYIPAMLIVGLIVGYTLGLRAAERQAAEHNSRAERRGRRRRRRSGRAADSSEPEAPDSDDDDG